MAHYEILTNLRYPGGNGDEIEVQVGEVRDDIPEGSLEWLLRDGHIRAASKIMDVKPPVVPQKTVAAPKTKRTKRVEG